MAFKVLTASAGSGKTAALVAEYLVLILKRPSDYSQILALTFTNKAAAEMKDRIFRYLDGLSEASHGRPHDTSRFLLEILRSKTGLEDNEIFSRAYQALRLILHQYDQFHVSTIDSFGHGIVKAFAHDLNLPQHFEVELEESALLEVAVAELVDQAGIDTELTKALLEFSIEKALSDKDWSVQKDLQRTSLKLFREDSLHYTELLANKHRDHLIRGKDRIFKMCAVIEANVRSKAESVFRMIREWDSDLFPFKSKGYYGLISQLEKGKTDKITEDNTRLHEAVDSNSAFLTKARAGLPAGLLAIEQTLLDGLGELSQYLRTIRSDYAFLIKVRAQVYQVILLGEVQNRLNNLRDERQTLHISEFNRIISKVVRSQPEPFIYERTGNRYRHFFLDEFQDTSVLQWYNLIPLMENGLAGGGEGLIVGDPKQAIYRFRNGEVELFTHLPNFPSIREFPEIHHDSAIMEKMMVKTRMEDNFRSLKGIVEFNSDFFDWCGQQLCEELRTAYENVAQSPKRVEHTGQVGFFFLADESKDLQLERTKLEILHLINELSSKNYLAGDIAILTRDNSTAAAMATFLLEQQIKVTSPESMLLTNSDQVRFLLDLLHLLNDPEDQIAAAGLAKFLLNHGMLGDMTLLEVFQRVRRPVAVNMQALLNEYNIGIRFNDLLRMGIYEACERAFQGLTEDVSPDDPFLTCFLDLVLERTINRQESLSEFVEWFDSHPDRSIALPSGKDSVRVMTVHKAKGLQFPVVIYPAFVNKNPVTKGDTWIETNDGDLPAVLVSLTRNSPNAELEELYIREKCRSELDELNVQYVAFTRAADCLYVLTPFKCKDEGMQLNMLLQGFLSQSQISFEPGQWVLNGEVPHHELTPIDFLQPLAKHIKRSPWADRLRLAFEDPSPEIEWGKLVHHFLSGIRSADTLEAYLGRYCRQYSVEDDRKNRLKEIAIQLLGHKELQGLFSGEVLQRSEITLSVDPDTRLRPDRVVFDGDSAIIADFKTGEPRDTHREQIELYASVMEQAGRKVTRKVLIYLKDEISVVVL